ncbi:hypothetical protein [Lacrimispora sp.]
MNNAKQTALISVCTINALEGWTWQLTTLTFWLNTRKRYVKTNFTGFAE